MPTPPSVDGPSAARDAVWFHAGFAAVAVVVLLIPTVVLPGRGAVLALGWKLFALVVLYNVALPLVGRVRGHRDWVALWAFLAPLSLFQVIPDAALASVLGSLDFPDTGGPHLGAVPAAMAGMWTIPLWLALFVAERQSGGDLRRGAVWAGALAGVLLVGAEATLAAPSPLGLWDVPVWRAVDVATVGPVAVYVVLPEILLGAVAWIAYRLTRSAGWPAEVGAAALVACVYLGALVASFGLVEHVAG